MRDPGIFISVEGTEYMNIFLSLNECTSYNPGFHSFHFNKINYCFDNASSTTAVVLQPTFINQLSLLFDLALSHQGN